MSRPARSAGVAFGLLVLTATMAAAAAAEPPRHPPKDATYTLTATIGLDPDLRPLVLIER